MEKKCVIDPGFQEYVASVKTKAETVINSFPKKIKELDELLTSPDFNTSLREKPMCKDLLESEASKNGHVNREAEDITTVTPCISLKGNPHVTRPIAILKPYISEFIDELNLLRTWINLLVPKIEDGNNFGVAIQEEILGDIAAAKGFAGTACTSISVYYSARAKLVSKVIKYPTITDYHRAIAELDQSDCILLRDLVSALCQHYVALYDHITKNCEKILTPRTTNHEHIF